MKKTLIEEITRIHEITYTNSNISEGFLGKLLDKAKSTLGLKKQDDPKKADIVNDSPENLFSTLEDILNTGGLNMQEKGQMSYQKSVESLQILLLLLGYSLPNYGVDGLYGPETSSAVEKFKQDNGLDTTVIGATPEMLKILIDKGKQKNIKPEEIRKYLDPMIPSSSGVAPNADKVKYAIDFLIKNGGYTLAQAAGIVGNLQVESGLNTSIEGDKNLETSSFGIAQWRESRLDNLKIFAEKNNKSITDLDIQLWFIIHELKTNYRNVDNLIRSSNDVTEIAQIVQSKYEVSTSASLNSRQMYANQFYANYTNTDNQKYA